MITVATTMAARPTSAIRIMRGDTATKSFASRSRRYETTISRTMRRSVSSGEFARPSSAAIRDSTMITARQPKNRAASIVAGRGRRTAVRMEAAASRTNRICVVQDTSSSALRVSASTVHPPR